MKNRRLLETIEVQMLMATTNLSDVLFRGMCSEWSGLPYAELSVLLAQLRALHCIHHTHHWQALGDSFYGDHLLFGRLYEAIAAEIDTVGEKVIGLSCVENVNLIIQINQITQFVLCVTQDRNAIPDKNDLVKRSMMCELDFLNNCAMAKQMLDAAGMLTGGVSNMIESIEDVHEGHVYLLKQRIMNTNVV